VTELRADFDANAAHLWTPDERQRFKAYMSSTEPLYCGIGHNSGARPTKAAESATVFEQFEAIVDYPDFTAEQKCILVKLRCRVNSKTLADAICGNEGLMRAASLKDPRALRAELRGLQGKSRELPEKRDERGRPTDDPIDRNHATIIIEERRGKASIVAFDPDRFQAILKAYWEYREQKRGARRPPASGSGGPAKPPASHAENPLRQTHPDPFPISKERERAERSPLVQEADATGRQRKRTKRQTSEQEIDEARVAYNTAAQAHGFTPCDTLTEARRKRLSERLAEIGGVDNFKRALTALPTDDFLMGRVRPRNGGAAFKLNLERLLSTSSRMGDVLARLRDAAGDAARSKPVTVGADAQAQANLEDAIARLRAEEEAGLWRQ